MQTVLGLSMTTTNVGLVLVEGDGPAGTTMGHDGFEVRRGGFSPVTTSEYVAEALSRTRAIADGQRVQSIGVTWSDDASLEASLLLDSLAEAGFDNVIAVRLPEATEAFARQIGQVIGSDVTAVCVVAPEAVVLLTVDSDGNGVQTAVSCDLETDHDLAEWLSSVLDGGGRLPDALVLLGSGDEFDAIARRLEGVVGIPVFAPAEAELALARGAAIASVHGRGPFRDPFQDGVRQDGVRQDGVSRNAAGYFEGLPAGRRPSLARTGPAAMLAGGVLTLVIGVSALVGLELLPDRSPSPLPPTTDRSVVNSAETPAAPPVMPSPQVPAPPSDAVPEAIPVPEAPAERVADAAIDEEPVAEVPVEQSPEAPPAG